MVKGLGPDCGWYGREPGPFFRGAHQFPHALRAVPRRNFGGRPPRAPAGGSGPGRFGLGTEVWVLPLGARFSKGSKGKGWLALVTGTRLLVELFTILRGLWPRVGRVFHHALPECCEL